MPSNYNMLFVEKLCKIARGIEEGAILDYAYHEDEWPDSLERLETKAQMIAWLEDLNNVCDARPWRQWQKIVFAIDPPDDSVQDTFHIYRYFRVYKKDA